MPSKIPAAGSWNPPSPGPADAAIASSPAIEGLHRRHTRQPPRSPTSITVVVEHAVVDRAHGHHLTNQITVRPSAPRPFALSAYRHHFDVGRIQITPSSRWCLYALRAKGPRSRRQTPWTSRGSGGEKPDPQPPRPRRSTRGGWLAGRIVKFPARPARPERIDHRPYARQATGCRVRPRTTSAAQRTRHDKRGTTSAFQPQSQTRGKRPDGPVTPRRGRVAQTDRPQGPDAGRAAGGTDRSRPAGAAWSGRVGGLAEWGRGFGWAYPSKGLTYRET